MRPMRPFGLGPLCRALRDVCSRDGMTAARTCAPARERRGASGPPQAIEPGCGAEPHVSQTRAVLAACLIAGVAVTARAADGLDLIQAVKAGRHEAVRALLGDAASGDVRAALRAAEADGTTALHWAVRADDGELVRMLLRAGADPAAATRHGVTPLALAAVNGSAAVTELLLKAGASPNVTLPEGETVLMTAARTGRPEVLRLLLEAGADVHARERWFGETALMWAAAEDHPGAIVVLAAHGADLNARSARLEPANRRNGQSIMPLGSWTPVMYAARQGALEAARALAELGADLNLTDPDGATALVLAIINAHYDVAALLADKGADPNVGDNEARMAALYAAVDMNTLAIGHGRPNTRPSGRLSALDLIERLLARGADPNARLAKPVMQRHHSAGDQAFGEGSTPFMRAAKSGDVRAMRLLLAAGADPRLAQPGGDHALMFAAGRGWRDGGPGAPSFDQGSEDEAIAAIAVCLASGIEIDAANAAGETALHAAVTGRGSTAIIRFLVEQGADLQARDAKGRTPLDLATGGRRVRNDIVQLLRELQAARQ